MSHIDSVSCLHNGDTIISKAFLDLINNKQEIDKLFGLEKGGYYAKLFN